MRMPRWILLAALLPALPADAALVPYDLPLLAQRSKCVVTGEVLSLRSYRGPFQSLGEVTFTEVTIRIASVLHGEPEFSEGAELKLHFLGGEVDGLRQVCPESPRYERGEKVLVFVREYDQKLWNTGWLQGKYTLAEAADGSTTVKGDPVLPISRDLPLDTVQSLIRLYTQPSGSGGSR
jgi:hypothetical protein